MSTNRNWEIESLLTKQRDLLEITERLRATLDWLNLGPDILDIKIGEEKP